MNVENNIKPAIENWINSNRSLIQDFSIQKDGTSFDFSIKPKKNIASEVFISIDEKSNSCDISIGSYTQICNYSFTQADELIKVLEAVKEGRVKESIFRVFGMRAKVHGTLQIGNRTLDDTGYVVPFNILAKIFKPTEEKKDFSPW